MTPTPPRSATRNRAPTRAMGWRARLGDWWASRHPRQDHCQLGQRNIYILPSRPGWGFAATLGLILLAAINEQLSLGYLLCFALAGAGLVAMHTTQGNLRGLQFSLKPPRLSAAGEPVQVEVQIHNPGAARYGIGLQWQGQALGVVDAVDAAQADISWTDVPAQGHATVLMRWTPPGRGLHALPTVRISSGFPLGLFRCWSLWRPAAQACVYPRPEQPCPPWPSRSQADPGHKDASPGVQGQERPPDEWDGVRAWRPGDRPRQVLWRKAAQRSHPEAELPVRELSPTPTLPARLAWSQVRELGLEPGLARLCAWVLLAEAQGRPYALSLPGVDIDSCQGPQQRETCLRALARQCLQAPDGPEGRLARERRP